MLYTPLKLTVYLNTYDASMTSIFDVDIVGKQCEIFIMIC